MGDLDGLLEAFQLRSFRGAILKQSEMSVRIRLTGDHADRAIRTLKAIGSVGMEVKALRKDPEKLVRDAASEAFKNHENH